MILLYLFYLLYLHPLDWWLLLTILAEINHTHLFRHQQLRMLQGVIEHVHFSYVLDTHRWKQHHAI